MNVKILNAGLWNFSKKLKLDTQIFYFISYGSEIHQQAKMQCITGVDEFRSMENLLHDQHHFEIPEQLTYISPFLSIMYNIFIDDIIKLYDFTYLV